jgi:hypothetical protein
MLSGIVADVDGVNLFSIDDRSNSIKRRCGNQIDKVNAQALTPSRRRG